MLCILSSSLVRSPEWSHHEKSVCALSGPMPSISPSRSLLGWWLFPAALGLCACSPGRTQEADHACTVTRGPSVLCS